MLKGIQHICFDKDGTLIDVHAYWVDIVKKRAELLVRDCRLPTGHVARLALSMGADIAAGRIIPGGPVGYKPRNFVVEGAINFLKQWDIDLDTQTVMARFAEVDRILQENNDYQIRVIDQVYEALGLLKVQGVRMSIFSSDRRENVRKNLAQTKLDEFIDVIIGGDDVFQSKPDPEGLRKACQELDASAAESIYVGDTEDDMMMAKKAGCRAVGVTTGLCDGATLRMHSETVFRNLKDMALAIAEGVRRV